MYSNKPDIQKFFGFLQQYLHIAPQLTLANRSRNMDSIEENFSKHFSSEEKKTAIAL
jgi:hypothetical protein